MFKEKSVKQKKPLISIVTVVFNSSDMLETTIKSIIPQLSDDVEYIIVDGGSTDGTHDIIKEYSAFITKLIIEPDTGIYNAMNKGCKISSGEYIHFLNAGDTYADKNSLNKIRDIILSKEPKFISSTVRYVLRSGDEKLLSMTGGVDTICHPGLIVRGDLYRENMFSEKYKYASDIEFFLRVIKTKDVLLNEQVLVEMPAGGAGSSLVCLRETTLIYIRNMMFLRATYSGAKLVKNFLSHFLTIR